MNDTNPRTLGGGPNGGYLQNDEDSGITVSFEFADGVILSESAKIEWNEGDLRITDVTEKFAKIKLFDNVSCNICSKSFKNKKFLTIHSVVHGEKEYKCEHCQKIFYQRQHLSRHKKIHAKKEARLVVESLSEFVELPRLQIDGAKISQKSQIDEAHFLVLKTFLTLIVAEIMKVKNYP